MMSNRRARPQAVLTVESSTWVSPTIVRLVAGGPGFSALALNDCTDAYVKLLFAEPEPVPPSDDAAPGERPVPDERPVRRTYTLRWVDVENQRLAIDFVVHGDEGVAAPWARDAKPGDTLVASGAGGRYAPDPTADHYVFVGDESALPAICAALEALPAEARGLAYLQVAAEESRLDLPGPAGIHATWLVGPADRTTLLADAMLAGPWPQGRVQVFAHGERESMKAVRAVAKELGVPREDLSLSGYWALGRTEDVFQAEKRQPVGATAD